MFRISSSMSDVQTYRVALGALWFFVALFALLAAMPWTASAATTISIAPGSLMNLRCPTPPPNDDRCRAVYYYAADGKRCVFPNERVYRSWYPDFFGLLSVTPEVLAEIPLGAPSPTDPGCVS